MLTNHFNPLCNNYYKELFCLFCQSGLNYIILLIISSAYVNNIILLLTNLTRSHSHNWTTHNKKMTD